MSETKRQVSPGAEKWLGKTFSVLNDGEIELVDYMGTEEQMVGIARISHGAILPHTDTEKAQKLINYFMANRHTSPFEFIETTWRWRLPIFVARQVIRHRTASVNEKSARYSELDAEQYCPALDRIQGQDTKNKQGSSGELDPQVKAEWLKALRELDIHAKEVYNFGLESGVAKELSRVVLPVGTYTDWVWKIDMHNLLHFLGLRLDSHAQYEVRVYAEAMWQVLQDAYPMICAAFKEYRLDAKTLNATEVEVLRKFVKSFGDMPVTHEEMLLFQKLGV